MSSQCVSCGTELPQVAYFCPACGKPSGIENVSSVALWPGRVLAAVAYFTFLPAIVLISVPQWRHDAYVRLHAVQSLCFWIACLVVSLVLRLLDFGFALLPLGLLIVFLTWGIAALAAGLLWFVLVLKALKGQWFCLPLMGELAARVSRPRQ